MILIILKLSSSYSIEVWVNLGEFNYFTLEIELIIEPIQKTLILINKFHKIF